MPFYPLHIYSSFLTVRHIERIRTSLFRSMNKELLHLYNNILIDTAFKLFRCCLRRSFNWFLFHFMNTTLITAATTSTTTTTTKTTMRTYISTDFIYWRQGLNAFNIKPYTLRILAFICLTFYPWRDPVFMYPTFKFWVFGRNCCRFYNCCFSLNLTKFAIANFSSVLYMFYWLYDPMSSSSKNGPLVYQSINRV